MSKVHRNRSVSEIAQRPKFTPSSIKPKILELARVGNSADLSQLLEDAKPFLSKIQFDDDFRWDLKNAIEAYNKSRTGVDLAIACLGNGIGFEPDVKDPITTNTVICTAQKIDTWKAVELSMLALDRNFKINPTILFCTIVDADEKLTDEDKVTKLARLARLSANLVDMKDPDCIGTYNVLLAKFGDPTPDRDVEDYGLSFRAHRVKKGIEVVKKLLDKGIRFDLEDKETRLRLNNFVRGVRTVAEELSHSEVDTKNESLKLMKEVFELMTECIGEYEIKGETVNSSFSSLFTNQIPLDNDLLKLLDSAFQKAVDLKQIRIHLNSTTMNVLLKYIIDSNCEDRFNVAERIINKANGYGYKFHDEIISRVNQGIGPDHAPIPVNKTSKHKPKSLKEVPSEEVNGLVPFRIMRAFFPDYEPDNSRFDSRLKGGLSTVTSYLN